MNETDTRANLVDPALAEAGWTARDITREYPVGPWRADYVLRDGHRIMAVIEAKGSSRLAEDGLIQAKVYAQQLGAPYAIATNGYTILLVDIDGGNVRQRSEFPTLAELREGLPPEPEPVPVVLPPRRPKQWGEDLGCLGLLLMWALWVFGGMLALGAVVWAVQGLARAIPWLLAHPQAVPPILIALGVHAGLSWIIRWRTRIHYGLALLVAIPVETTIICLLFIIGALLWFVWMFAGQPAFPGSAWLVEHIS